MNKGDVNLFPEFRRVVDRRSDLPAELTLLIGEPEAMGYDEIQDAVANAGLCAGRACPRPLCHQPGLVRPRGRRDCFAQAECATGAQAASGGSDACA